VLDAPEILDHAQQAEADYAIKKLTYERLLNVWKENPDVIAKQDVDVAEAAAEGPSNCWSGVGRGSSIRKSQRLSQA